MSDELQLLLGILGGIASFGFIGGLCAYVRYEMATDPPPLALDDWTLRATYEGALYGVFFIMWYL